MNKESRREPWRCRWGWHRWSVWSEPEAGQESTLLSRSVRVVEIQERTCLACNVIQLRKIT